MMAPCGSLSVFVLASTGQSIGDEFGVLVNPRWGGLGEGLGGFRTSSKTWSGLGRA